MIVETSRAERLAEDPEFRKIWHMPISLKEKSQRLKAGPKTVREAAKLAGYAMPEIVDFNVAPTDEEEQASLSSLKFAPMVAARVKEVTDMHIKYMNGEIDSFPWDSGRRELFVMGKIRGGDEGRLA